MNMVEGRAYKTKLCILYKRGHCPRHNCSFAHGSAELRHYPGKQDYLADDLREKLDKRHSPRRHVRGKRSFDEGSPTRSLDKSSSRRSRKRHHFEGQSDSADDRGRERSNADKRSVLEKQLKEFHEDIKIRELRKSQLRVLIDEKIEESLSFDARIEDLTTMLSKETEEFRRLTSKIKKIVRAHRTCGRLEDELKSSQVRLKKLGDQFLGGSAPSIGNAENVLLNDAEKSSYHGIRFSKENHSESQKYIGSSKRRRAKVPSHRGSLLSTSAAANAKSDANAKDDVDDAADAKNATPNADLSSQQTKNYFSQSDEKRSAEALEDMVDVDIV